MAFLVAIAAVLCGLAAWTGTLAAPWADRLAAAIDRIVERALSGAVDWRDGAFPLEQVGEDQDPGLAACLDGACTEGLGIATSLQALRRELLAAGRLGRNGRALARLLLGRAAAALAAAGGARMALAPAGETPSMAAADTGALVFAVTLLVAIQWLVRRWLPRSWLGQTELSPQALAWFDEHLAAPMGGSGNDDDCGSPALPPDLVDSLLELNGRELASGVSLAAERRRRLDRWAEAQTAADRQRLERLGELMPLLELFGAGLPVALTLAVPLCACLAGT